MFLFLWVCSSYVAHFEEQALVSETCKVLCIVRRLDTGSVISIIFLLLFINFVFCSSIVKVLRVLLLSHKSPASFFYVAFLFFQFSIKLLYVASLYIVVEWRFVASIRWGLIRFHPFQAEVKFNCAFSKIQPIRLPRPNQERNSSQGN